MKQFSRNEIKERLYTKRANRQPIVIGGAGVGLVAKVADRAGIDLIMAYKWIRLHQMMCGEGLTLPIEACRLCVSEMWRNMDTYLSLKKIMLQLCIMTGSIDFSDFPQL